MLSRFASVLALIAIIGALAVVSDAGDVRAGTVIPQGSNMPGDVTCDNQVTTADVLGYLTTLQDTAPPAPCLESNGDLDCDDSVRPEDAVEALFIVAGVPRGACGGAESSLDQIQAALSAGDIDEDEAVLYSVFAAFDDSRLPSQFGAGLPDSLEMPIDVTLVASMLDDMSPGVRAQLEPFFIAPMHAGSWWDIRYNGPAAAPASLNTVPGPILDGDWAFVDAQTAQVKLWYPVDDFEMQQLASSTAQELDSHIWRQLTQLMGRDPLPDLGSIMPGRGGDDRIDVLISNDMPTFGALGLLPNLCERTTALIFADPEAAVRAEVPFHIAVGHELFHALTFGYDLAQQPGGMGGCGDAGYNWWSEASATWSEDFLYPSVNSEHTGRRGDSAVKAFVNNLGDPLEDDGDSFRGINTDRPYGAYLFAYYAVHEHGTSFVRQAWENMQGQGSLEAIDAALPNGFEEAWPKFVVYALGIPPYDMFKQWDNVQQKPDWNGTTFNDYDEWLELPGPGWDNQNPDRDEIQHVRWDGDEHLSATANHYKFVDQSIRAVAVYNGYSYNLEPYDSGSATLLVPEYRPDAERRGLRVQLLIKIDGEWTLEEWTDPASRFFCRDRADQRIEELIIVSTNSVPETDYEISDPPVFQGPQIFISDLGCYRYQGTITNRYYGDDYEETIELKDAVVEAIPHFTGQTPAGANFNATEGTIDWSMHQTAGDCVYEGSEVGLPVETGFQEFGLWTFFTEGPWKRAGYATFRAQPEVEIRLICPGEPTETYTKPVAVGFPSSPDPFKVQNGAVIEGHTDDGLVETTWQFDAVRE